MLKSLVFLLEEAELSSIQESDLNCKKTKIEPSQSTWCGGLPPLEPLTAFAKTCRFLGPTPEQPNQNVREVRTGNLNF